MTIEELRLEKGLTRAAFAESIGIDLSTLEDCESGKREPGANALEAIKAVYGVDLSIPALVEADEPEAAEAVETAVAEAVEEAPEAKEAVKAVEEAPEAKEAVKAVEEAVTRKNTDAVTEEAKAGEPVEEAVEEAEAGEPVEEAIMKAEAGEAADEEAALIAAAEKEARKAAKKARKAAELAARQKADEEATQRVIGIISSLSSRVNLEDRDAVVAARDAYDNLTDDQELLIPGDVLRLLFSAEQRIEDAVEAAAREAAASIPIEECLITVKDVTFTGKKIKKPSVKVVCGETDLEPGEDYSLKYDKKARDIGLYMLTVKGKGRFTGSVKVPFCVVPKASEYVRLLDDDKQAAKTWKLLKRVEGCQIEYSQNKDFSDSRKAKIREPKDLARVLKKLKDGKKIYLRVRLFAKVKKKHHYSDWSKVKAIKV